MVSTVSQSSVDKAKASVFSRVLYSIRLCRCKNMNDTPLESGNGFCEILEATAICQHESKGVSKAKNAINVLVGRVSLSFGFVTLFLTLVSVMQFDDEGCYAKLGNPWSSINSQTSIDEAKASVFSLKPFCFLLAFISNLPMMSG